uniref:thiol oxidase n=1 Tax=viral metagenome TaxID=1070528 RepID=A0A6C0HTS8_9ZZZZ
MKKFNPDIWGPHYWFFLHTVAESYPLSPNEVTKRKYYDLIQNFPLFIPDSEIGDKFSKMLDKYPVQPYLGNRDSFVRWVHFIHNKVNYRLGKIELSLPMALEKYRDEYKPKVIVLSEQINMKRHYIHAVLIVGLLFLIYYSSQGNQGSP